MRGLLEQMKKGGNIILHKNFDKSLLDQAHDFFTSNKERQFILQTGDSGLKAITKMIKIKIDLERACPTMINLNHELYNVAKFTQGDIIYIDYHSVNYGFIILEVFGGYSYGCSFVDSKILPVELKKFDDGAMSIIPLKYLLTAKKLIYERPN